MATRAVAWGPVAATRATEAPGADRAARSAAAVSQVVAEAWAVRVEAKGVARVAAARAAARAARAAPTAVEWREVC